FCDFAISLHSVFASANPVDSARWERPTRTFRASLSGLRFPVGWVAGDRTRGETVDRMFEDLSVLSTEHDRSTRLYRSGRPVRLYFVVSFSVEFVDYFLSIKDDFRGMLRRSRLDSARFRMSDRM
ncbi:hypothetical protein Dimus_024258, partial [Dionaea muscipula]